MTETPLWEHEAVSLARKLMADKGDRRFSDKWGPCGAIPVVRQERSETIGIGSTVTGEADEVKVLATAALKKEGKLAKGEIVVSAHLRKVLLQDGGFSQDVAEVRIRRANVPPRRRS